MEKLKTKYPDAAFVLTLGENGSWYFDKNRCFKQDIYKVKAVDTTAAGDTFCGYFLVRNHKRKRDSGDSENGKCRQCHRRKPERRGSEYSGV